MIIFLGLICSLPSFSYGEDKASEDQSTRLVSLTSCAGLLTNEEDETKLAYKVAGYFPKNADESTVVRAVIFVVPELSQAARKEAYDFLNQIVSLEPIQGGAIPSQFMANISANKVSVLAKLKVVDSIVIRPAATSIPKKDTPEAVAKVCEKAEKPIAEEKKEDTHPKDIPVQTAQPRLSQRLGAAPTGDFNDEFTMFVEEYRRTGDALPGFRTLVRKMSDDALEAYLDMTSLDLVSFKLDFSGINRDIFDADLEIIEGKIPPKLKQEGAGVVSKSIEGKPSKAHAVLRIDRKTLHQIVTANRSVKAVYLPSGQ